MNEARYEIDVRLEDEEGMTVCTATFNGAIEVGDGEADRPLKLAMESSLRGALDQLWLTQRQAEGQ